MHQRQRQLGASKLLFVQSDGDMEAAVLSRASSIGGPVSKQASGVS